MNLTDPCRTIRASTTVEGCQAGGLGQLFQNMREYIAESPKQGSKRFNSIEKTFGFDHLVIIYLWFTRPYNATCAFERATFVLIYKMFRP